MRQGQQRTFTDAYIRALKPKAAPYKRSEAAPKGEGRLIVRVQPSGAKEFFYRYRVNGDDKTVSVGRYDASGNNGKTLAQIRQATGQTRQLQRNTGDVKAHIQEQGRQRAIEKRKGTLRQLLAAYVDSLTVAGKESAKQAESIFERNVSKPFPILADTKANEIVSGDIQRILGRMVKAGVTRQVNKTRAYLRAAFQYGAKADHDPRTVAKEGVLFGLAANPVVMVPRIAEYERVGERALSEDELRAYWKALEEAPAVQRATLRLNLALACQRPTQLLRAGWTAFDLDADTLLIRDSKGRGGSRDHLLPLTPFALAQLKLLRELNAEADSPFTSDGKRPLSIDTLTGAVRDVSAKLKKSDQIPEFQQRDLRRTAETMLQKLGIDREVRAHLLSHGRSKGVQGKHYERYDFLPEKRAALEKWARHMERIISGKAAKVTPIRGTAA